MEQNLRVPGPTPIPRAVRDAQGAQMIDHRGSEFSELLNETSERIGRLIGTTGEVLLLTGSGTGAMEAAVVNSLSPGDRVLAVSVGAFGDRFARIAAAFGADVERLEFEWGAPADPARLRDALAGQSYRAVLLTHNETSTGVVNPLQELVTEVHAAAGDPLVVVDGISGLGALPFEMDAWGVDMVISASQKAWMASPGIAMAALGERAVRASETATMPRVYWDFREARAFGSKGQTPWTPAVAVLYGLRVGVDRLTSEGREATWARHAATAAAAQAGLQALGLRLVAPAGARSPTVTAAWLPDGVEWGPINAAMRSRGLVLAGGQGKMAGRVLRLGHMGEVSLDEIREAISILGGALVEHGHSADPASAAEEAERAYRAAGQSVATP
jgi:aspartate aminotransferase-like enzyme